MASFLAFVDDMAHLAVDRRQAFRAHIEKLKGCEVVLTVKKKPHEQGTQQLKYLRGVVIPDIAAACGYSAEDPDDCQEVYDGLMWRLFRLPDGPMGQPRRESCAKDQMSRERLTQVIDTIILWAETHITGCQVRRPEDVDFERVVDQEFA
jgi:hypothetical protein